MLAIFKKAILLGILLMLLLGAFILLCNYWVLSNGKGRIFSDAQKIPANKVALVLGTNPLLAEKYTNYYFKYRMDAAAELYHQGKIKHLILSGDNGRKSYDEPSAMRDSLVKAGVPFEAISLDYAGFRTLDSVVRCKKVFQQENITIISQAFHNPRALFIADKYNIKAVAYNAQQPYPNIRTKAEIREYLARCKSVLDLYIFNKQPKFLGKKINLPI